MISSEMRFTFARAGIYSELVSYKKHAIQVNDLLDAEVKAFEQYHHDIASEMDPDDASEYMEYMSEEYWNLADTLPSIQRKSELISIYTLLENSLNQICSIYENNLNNPVKLSDLSAHGIIDKSKKYLEKVAEISFPSNSSEWKEITKIQQIRNAFVHSDGLIKSGNQELVNYVTQSQFLSLKNGTKVIVNDGFTLHCLELFHEFFIELFKGIETSN